MSTWEANFYDFLDKEMATRQSHNIANIFLMVMCAQCNMRYGDRPNILVNGETDKGKSWAYEVIRLLVVPETISREDSTTAKVSESGLNYYCGRVVYNDDAGSKNSKMFSKEGTEESADNQFKSMLSTGKGQRTRYHRENGVNHVIVDTTDGRASWISMTNSTMNIPSFKSRTKIFQFVVADRHADISQLRDRARGVEVARFTEWQDYIRRMQIFCNLTFFYIRAGVIRYNRLVEGREISGPILQRFIAAIKKVKTTSSTTSECIANRKLEAQIIPFAENFAMMRLFNTICVGGYPDNPHLRPGAPFDYSMFLEIDKYKLFVVTEEDFIRSVSYFEDDIARDALQEFFTYITVCARTHGKTGFDVRPEGIVKKEMDKYLLQEVDSNGILTTDYNWINLSQRAVITLRIPPFLI
jgi:hypothetical protein